MASTRLELAQDFIWKNARLLERQLFACLFAGGSPQAVAHALQAYQNPDGGFGQALEPDKRCPESQPEDVRMAFEILDRTGLLDDPRVQAELVLPACDFLASASTPAGGVPFALPSVTRYPRAPWWQAQPGDPAALNPTAGIVGLLLKHAIRHPWLEGASAFCWQAIQASESDAYHDLILMIAFLEAAPDRTRAEAELERIAARLQRPGVVELDPQAVGYVKMPLDWAPTPASYCSRLFDQPTLARHLAALAAKQRADGGWPISWEALSPAVELEWRGWVTVNALHTLQAYEFFGDDLRI